MSKPLSCKVYIFLPSECYNMDQSSQSWILHDMSPLRQEISLTKDSWLLSNIMTDTVETRTGSPQTLVFDWSKCSLYAKPPAIFSIREVVLPSSGGSSAVTWIHNIVTDEYAQFRIYCGCLLVNHYRKNKKIQ